MSRKKGISPKQVDRIKELANKGYSANKIQKTLKQEHMGLRRTLILNYVREFKGKPAQFDVEKYIPKKYKHIIRRGSGAKKVVLYGWRNGQRFTIIQRGSGKQLYWFVRHELERGEWDANPRIES